MLTTLLVITATVALMNWHILFRRGHLVTRVIDGDTIEVSINGKLEIVRYILIDAPELGTLDGERAKRANQRLVDGQRVNLVSDKGDRDRYGRLLRYVYVGNRFVNKVMLQRGHAKIMIVRPNIAMLSELQNLRK